VVHRARFSARESDREQAAFIETFEHVFLHV